MENDIICQPGRRLSTALSLSANWNWCIYKPNLTQCIRLQSANVAVSRCQSAVSGRDERADRDRKLHQWRDGGGCARAVKLSLAPGEYAWTGRADLFMKEEAGGLKAKRVGCQTARRRRLIDALQRCVCARTQASHDPHSPQTLLSHPSRTHS